MNDNWIGYSSEDDEFIIYDRVPQALGVLPENINIQTLRNLQLISRSYLILTTTTTFEGISDILQETFQEYMDKYGQKEITDDLDLKYTIYKDVSKELSQKVTECCVCQEYFEDTESVGILSCEHIYHEKCIKLWGKKSNTCPLCRIEIPLKIIEPQQT